MRCAHCGWPSDEMRVVSTHHTSEGWVRYRRCVCGVTSIEIVTLDDDGTRAAPVWEPATAS